MTSAATILTGTPPAGGACCRVLDVERGCELLESELMMFLCRRPSVACCCSREMVALASSSLRCRSAWLMPVTDATAAVADRAADSVPDDDPPYCPLEMALLEGILLSCGCHCEVVMLETALAEA